MRWYWEDQQVIDTIEACDGHASLTVLAEAQIIYYAWQLHSMNFLRLEYRETNPDCITNGWGFEINGEMVA